MITAMGDVMREAYKRGWITTRDGNVSVRRNKCLYITPSGVRKTIIHPEHVSKFKIVKSDVRRDGTFEKIIASDCDQINPSIELDMHWKVHITKGKKLGSVVHLHPTHVVATMYAGYDLQKICDDFPELHRYTKVGKTVKSFPPGSNELAEFTAEYIDGVDIVGQDRHGVAAYAENPWDAFEHIERLDHICKIVLASGKK